MTGLQQVIPTSGKTFMLPLVPCSIEHTMSVWERLNCVDFKDILLHVTII